LFNRSPGFTKTKRYLVYCYTQNLSLSHPLLSTIQWPFTLVHYQQLATSALLAGRAESSQILNNASLSTSDILLFSFITDFVDSEFSTIDILFNYRQWMALLWFCFTPYQYKMALPSFKLASISLDLNHVMNRWRFLIPVRRWKNIP
jgi:hypothetical protein